MVIVFELQCQAWQHEEVNSGLLRLVRRTTDEKIVLLSTKEQYDAVKHQGIPESIEHRQVDILEFDSSLVKTNISFYKELLQRELACINPNAKDKVIFSSSATAVMYAIDEVLNENNYDSQFILIQHANIEKIHKLYNEQKVCYSDFQAIDRLRNHSNVRLVSYNPYLKEYGIDFLHHPVDQGIAENIYQNNSENKFEIGVYGASVNKLCRNMLKALQKRNLLYKNMFLIYHRARMDAYDTKYMLPVNDITVVKRLNGFDRKEIKQLIGKVRWIFLPYSNDMYTASMSGILADAIRYEVPIIALNSPIIQYYNGLYEIGIIEKDIETLVKCIETGALDDAERYCRYKSNMAKLKAYMEAENTVLCKQIMES